VPEVAGPSGLVWNVAEPGVWAIWKFGKNPQAAKEFIAHLIDHQREAMEASRGTTCRSWPTTTRSRCPGSAVLQDQYRITAFFGYPGPMTPPAQEVLTTFIIPDMFTRVARGSAVDEAMKWGVREIRRICKWRAAPVGDSEASM